MSASHCENCRFWKANSVESTIGQCRRQSPVCGDTGRGINFFPKTTQDAWCGEWAERASDRAQRLKEQNEKNLRRIREGDPFDTLKAQQRRGR